MHLHTRFKLRWVSPPLFIGLLLSICIIFLQVGFTYYLSFQVLALALLLAVIINDQPLIVNLVPLLLTMAIFTSFLTLTMVNVPWVVSGNSENFFITLIGVVGYAAMIVTASNIVFRAPEKILLLFRFVTLVTLIAITTLIFVTDLSIFPFLNREALILQNTTLIDNFATLEVLVEDFSMRSSLGLEPDIDLFYGEQSFLSVVIFVCIASNLISDRLLRMGSSKYEQARSFHQGRFSDLVNSNLQGLVLVAALASMVYIKSFSSFFYVLVIGISFFLSIKFRHFRLKLTFKRLILALLVIVLLSGSLYTAVDYYMYRLSSVSDSLSFEQRFASFFSFGFQEYLMGISDIGDMPQYGFQNGILYIIGISGLGGICLIGFIFYRVYILSRPVGVFFLAAMSVLAIFSQNGGIFSPSKVVLFSLVLIPLSCVNQIRLSTRVVRVECDTEKI